MPEGTPTYLLTTTARIKTMLGISVSTHDNLLNRLIIEMSDFIENYCGRRFMESEYEELVSFDRQKNSYIFTKQIPITAISKIEWRAGTFDDPQYQDIPTTDYAIDGDGKAGIIKVDGGWLYKGTNVVRVNYTAGYSIDFDNFGDVSVHNLPADITAVCESLVITRFKRRESEGKQSESASVSGGGSLTWINDITKENREILDRYVRQAPFN